MSKGSEPPLLLPDRLAHARQLAPAAVALMQRLVKIESPSRDEEGIRDVQSLLAGEAEKRGGRTEWISAPGYGAHLVADFGFAPEDGGAPAPLLVVGHVDTVHPRGTILRFPVRRDDDRLHGPGVYDMKGSWAAVIGAMDLIALEGRDVRPLRLLITCDEEIGAPHSRPLLEAEGRRAAAALVLEPALAEGRMKVRRKGVARYGLSVRGRPAHAGVEPERGASAVHELARILLRALDAADIERGTTVNAGLMRGGTAVNVVAEEASAELDVRFWTADEARRMDAWIREIRSQDPGCTLKVEGGVDRWAMERSAEGDALVAMVQAAAGSLGRFLEAGSTGGASDGQILAAVGCPVVDGLGIEGAGAHTLEEHVVLADIPFRIALYATLLGLP